MDMEKVIPLDLSDRDELPNLIPFDPETMKPQDIGFGQPSTEILISEDSPEGQVWNIPSLWWSPEGNPTYVSPRTAARLAYTYEKENDVKLPRFPKGAYKEASEAAQESSSVGGATNRKLAN